jgi:hypothetical protein
VDVHLRCETAHELDSEGHLVILMAVYANGALVSVSVIDPRAADR